MAALRWLVVGLVGAILVAAAWILGFAVAERTRPDLAPVPEDVEAPAAFELFDEVWSYVDREYYGDRPGEDVISQGAARGLVAGLDDPWAIYLAPAGAEADLPTAPELLDVGLWVMAVPGGARVLSVLPDSPAAATDLAPGDEIVALREDEASEEAPEDDGTEQRPGHEAAALPILAQLRDPARPVLDLVAVPVEGPAFGVLITRTVAAARPEVALSSPEAGVALVRIPTIDAASAEALAAALPGVPAAATRWIVDLRDNPGGDPSALPGIAGHFLEGALYVAADEGEERTVEAEGAPRDIARLVVLVNEGTVGEAEILAAALREQAGAEIVGAATYGRDALPETIVLSDGSRVRLTGARWSTPGGASVADGGLAPDRAVEEREDQLAAALDAARAEARAAREGDDGG